MRAPWLSPAPRSARRSDSSCPPKPLASSTPVDSRASDCAKPPGPPPPPHRNLAPLPPPPPCPPLPGEGQAVSWAGPA